MRTENSRRLPMRSASSWTTWHSKSYQRPRTRPTRSYDPFATSHRHPQLPPMAHRADEGVLGIEGKRNGDFGWREVSSHAGRPVCGWSVADRHLGVDSRGDVSGGRVAQLGAESCGDDV